MPRHPETPVDRVRRRMAECLDDDRDKPMALRRTQVGLAAHLGITKSALNELLNQQSASHGLLARLDGIAAYLGSSPAELVKGNQSELVELSDLERRVIRHWRAWPGDVRENVLILLEYFGAMLPEERELREYGLLLRQLSSARRQEMIRVLRDAVRYQRTMRRATRASADAQDRIVESNGPAEIRRRRP